MNTKIFTSMHSMLIAICFIQFMALMTGLNKANSIYTCIWCTVAKEKRYPHRVTRGVCVHTLFTHVHMVFHGYTDGTQVYWRLSTTHHLLVVNWEPWNRYRETVISQSPNNTSEANTHHSSTYSQPSMYWMNSTSSSGFPIFFWGTSSTSRTN